MDGKSNRNPFVKLWTLAALAAVVGAFALAGCGIGAGRDSAAVTDVESIGAHLSPVEVLSGDGAQLRARFNADTSKTRLVMLVSPTCPFCRDGARVVHDDVIARIDDERLVAYVVWEPIMEADTERAAREATALLPDDRVVNYWVRSDDVGKLFQSPVDLTSEPAWDVYLVYERGVRWSDASPPRPSYFMHQLRGRLPDDRMLDVARLRDEIGAMLDR